MKKQVSGGRRLDDILSINKETFNACVGARGLWEEGTGSLSQGSYREGYGKYVMAGTWECLPSA